MHVTESFGGGVIQSIAKICNFAQDEYDLVVVYSIRPQTPEKFTHFYPPGTKFELWNAVRSINPVADFKAVLSLRKYVAEHNPDIIHLHSSKAGAVGRLAFPFGKKGMTILYTPRAYGFLQLDLSPAKRMIYSFIEKVLGVFPHITVACGAGEYALAQKTARKSAVINNSISIEYLDKLAGKRKKYDKLTVCSSGRISYQKNFPLFVEIAGAFEDKNVDFLWVGGDVPEDITIPKNMKVTGWIDYPDGILAISQADIYLQTSRWEGLSLTVLEAMGLGLPIVISDAVGNKEMVKEAVDGFVCDQKEKYVEKISVLIADGKMRQNMGQAGRTKIISEYSNETCKRRWLEFYNEILTKKS